MTKIIVFLILVLFSFCASAQKEQHMNFQTRMLVASMNGDESKSIFVRGNVSKINRYLSSQKLEAKSNLKNLVYVSLSKRQITYLATQNYVEGFEFQWSKNHLLLDSALIQNNIDSIHDGLGEISTPFTGKGVLVGIIDTGIDGKHGDFLDTNGNTRVLNVWDQTLPFDATYTPPIGYGQAFDSADINLGPIAHEDQSRHGTQVTAMAASNGNLANNYKGMAPETDILAVELDFTGANINASVDAWQWLCDRADELDQPIVMNASYGDYLGSHDGLDAQALYLDSLLAAKPGRLFASAAGNSGNQAPYHVQHSPGVDTLFTTYQLNSSSTLGPTVFLDIWTDTSDFHAMEFSMGAELTTTGESRGMLAFRNILDDNLVGSTVLDSIMNNGNKLAEVQVYSELRGGQYNVQVYIQSPDSLYNYSLLSTGNGKLDIWSAAWLGIYVGPEIVYFSNSYGSQIGSSHPNFIYQAPDTLQSIVSSFNCSPNVMSVGNYNCQREFIDFDGNTQTGNEPNSVLNKHSSKGPSRRGDFKPNISASGGGTMSAIPLAKGLAWQTSNPHKLSPDGFHSVNGGTSMASPCVAGVGALLLEKCPSLTQTEFINIIQATAKEDLFTQQLGPLPNNAYGYGKLNGTRAIAFTNFNDVLVGVEDFCFGDSVTLSTAASYTDYTWSDGSVNDFLIVDSTLNGHLITSNNFGCKSDTMFYDLVENALPIISFVSRQHDSLFISTDGDIQWYHDDSPISGSIDTLHVIVSNGDYHAIATSPFGCIAVSDTVNFVFTEALEEKSRIVVYPNPAKDVVLIETENKIDRLTMRNINGQVVFSSTPLSLSALIEVEELRAGLYFITIESNLTTSIVKIEVIK